MLPRVAALATVAATVLTLSGCMTTQSFVDPMGPKATYAELKKRPTAAAMRLDVRVLSNGVPRPAADAAPVRSQIERVLGKSGLVQATEGAGDTFTVVVNQIHDDKIATAKRLGTQATLGLVGHTVADVYEMTVSVTRNGKTVDHPAVRHTLHIAHGNAPLPLGVQMLPTAEGLDVVIEQMLLRSLKDMQRAGLISMLGVAPARA
jgi:hypothetical protein